MAASQLPATEAASGVAACASAAATAASLLLLIQGMGVLHLGMLRQGWPALGSGGLLQQQKVSSTAGHLAAAAGRHCRLTTRGPAVMQATSISSNSNRGAQQSWA
jgi:hypothetical protein